jgi:SAM-dependent methyltransferase
MPPVAQSSTLQQCRSCSHAELHPVLSLGSMPLANSLVRRERLASPDPSFPLAIVLCARCTLLQLTETIDPEQLFRDYVYFSSYSESLIAYAGRLAAEVASRRRLGTTSLVVEIASNDGYLLQHYKQRGIPVLGIEPARNVARVAQEERGIPTLCEFFGSALAQRLRGEGRRADVIHAHNVLAHVPDLNGFVAGIATLLTDDGHAVIEVPYVRDVLDASGFDTIYHEHLCYFSLTALVALFERHGLAIREVAHVPVQGGSLRLSVGRASDSVGSSTRALLAEERQWDVARPDPYLRFANDVAKLRTSLTTTLRGLRDDAKTIAAYGASAKATVLLNYCGIGSDLVEFVVDSNPHKAGLWIPGVRIPIHPPARLLESMPDFTLLLVRNIADEILSQQAEYRRRGGRFIQPLPRVEFL